MNINFILVIVYIQNKTVKTTAEYLVFVLCNIALYIGKSDKLNMVYILNCSGLLKRNIPILYLISLIARISEFN